MKYYKVPAPLLKQFIIGYAKCAALENGGVDNWEYYGESIDDYFIDVAKELKIDIDDDFGFDDYADKILEECEEVE
ncbi:MAG: hypothetical protein NC548_22660 [Lachnospiraceae bacterium]|nr:hypothetical protein [Lachnospiraceae bacterium]